MRESTVGHTGVIKKTPVVQCVSARGRPCASSEVATVCSFVPDRRTPKSRRAIRHLWAFDSDCTALGRDCSCNPNFSIGKNSDREAALSNISSVS
eukprot:g65662.t1